MLGDARGESALVESELEALLLRLLVAAGLPCPVPQFAVTIGRAHYRLDFAYPTLLIAIEGDGFEFHSERTQFEHDRARQNDLVLAGWLILRFTWRQIVHEPELVVRRLRAALDLRSATAAQG